uniref:Myosin-J heavy chain-like n=1 Tax=Piliocolobus tephrosceles TaxID=591936 RepID=A0A8C9LHU1_9PRIM
MNNDESNQVYQIKRKKQQEYFIGILDIYGFENFSEGGTNGFEQLCINYANEVLHAFFLKQIMYNEHKTYYEENLRIDRVYYNDNSTVISLIGNTKDVSMYTILEDLALFNCSNKNNEENKKNLFYEKINKNIINTGKYKNIIRNGNNYANNSFIISHYAGDVLYDSQDFFDKNVDILTNDIEQFLSSCNSFISINLLKKKKYEPMQNNELMMMSQKKEETQKLLEVSTSNDIKQNRKRKMSVKEIISSHGLDVKLGTGGTAHATVNTNYGSYTKCNMYKNKVKSIFSFFKKQLEILTNKLECTNSKFIRCIKPNEKKKPRYFDKNLVLNQLIMSGMIDILNLMKNGYPCRVLYDDIWGSYNNIIPMEMKNCLTPKVFCEIVLNFLQISHNEYKFGITKIFFRFGVLSLINELLNKNNDNKNKFVECVYKYWLYRKKKKILNFVLFGCRFKLLFKKQRAKMLMEQGIYLYNNYYLYNIQKKHIKKILFYYFHVYKQRTYFINLRKSTLIIQTYYRTYVCRKHFLHIKRKIMLIQDYYLFHKYYKKRVYAANIIRKNWIMYITKSDYKYVANSVVKIQKAFKNYMKKKYIDYCLEKVQVKKQKIEPTSNKTMNVKQELEIDDKKKKLKTYKKHPREEEDANRIGSFICIDKRIQTRQSFAFGDDHDNAANNIFNIKRRKTWHLKQSILNNRYKRINRFMYNHDNTTKDDNDKTNSSTFNKNNPNKEIRRNSYMEDKPFISVGNIINSNDKSKNNMTDNFICNSNMLTKTYTQKNFKFRNLSVCSGGRSIDTKNKNCKNNSVIYSNTKQKQMERRTYNHTNTKTDFMSSYKTEKSNVYNFLKNTIYDRYIEKYKQNHLDKQKEKKKKSIYIKSNYNNISNIYSVHKPTKETKLEEKYNFDVTDAIIIPEDFQVYESNIPEPNIMLAHHVSNILFQHIIS